jgi:hypothetical protein
MDELSPTNKSNKPQHSSRGKAKKKSLCNNFSIDKKKESLELNFL